VWSEVALSLSPLVGTTLGRAGMPDGQPAGPFGSPKLTLRAGSGATKGRGAIRKVAL